MLILIHILLVIPCALHVMLRKHRTPDSRMAWLLCLVALPYAGVIGYLLLGNTHIGKGQLAALRKAKAALPPPSVAPGWDEAANRPMSPDPRDFLFRVGQSISNYAAMGGNRAELVEQGDAAIDRMITDIDAATGTVHLMFYIWLTDHNGHKMAEALKRAVARGVTCRAMVDDIGSRDLIKSDLWTSMGEKGVKTGIALKVGNPVKRIFNGRIDLRNHRKVLVIDNRITYCGSQNCADPAFLPKAKYGPWVDAVMRFEGPVVRQNQHLFAIDWMGNGGDDVSALLHEPMPDAVRGFTAQVVGTGPTYRASAMPEMFETLIYAAREWLYVTTPYYVPDPSIQAALCAAANRGVDTTIIFPARNDDFAVGGTSRSYYAGLLEAGVKVFEFQPGLLHTKSLTMDGDVTLIGSANMDRRSFDLNFENNILLVDKSATAEMRARQAAYQAQSREILLSEVERWPWTKRLWDNALAMISPVL